MKVRRRGHPPKFDKAMADMQKQQVKMGFFEEAKYPDGESVAAVAAQNEFGNPAERVPARPFFRPTVENKKEHWGLQFAGAMIASFEGKIDFSDALDQIGGESSGDVSKTISMIYEPPLSPATIRARAERGSSGKASTKPLVDTGLMMQSVTYKVERK